MIIEVASPNIRMQSTVNNRGSLCCSSFSHNVTTTLIPIIARMPVTRQHITVKYVLSVGREESGSSGVSRNGGVLHVKSAKKQKVH